MFLINVFILKIHILNPEGRRSDITVLKGNKTSGYWEEI